ncbi:hypothetical protein [Nitrosomonas communis]
MKILADIILIAGLCMLGYGLWLYSEPLSFSVMGALLTIGGVLIGRNN